MGPAPAAGLNVSGEDGDAHVVRQGATHTSRGQRTTRHAHHAWKIHVGLDAPVWLESRGLHVPASDGARVLVVPPNVEHATGAVGLSVAFFIEPGSRATPWREHGGSVVATGAGATRAVELCSAFVREELPPVADLVDEIACLARNGTRPRLDRRAGAFLEHLRADLGASLPAIAGALGISVDRLTHLVSGATGIPPRTHVLWQRVLRVLGEPAAPPNLAAAAAAAGFSDHAHMTRSFRRFLGRAPSEFKNPPVVLAPWTTPQVAWAPRQAKQRTPRPCSSNSTTSTT